MFDARGGWNNGFPPCAHWLCWRVGLEPGAARERVRVARALSTLPRLAQALARGELSYSKVRALTLATPETEERLLKVSRVVPPPAPVPDAPVVTRSEHVTMLRALRSTRGHQGLPG